MILALVSSDEKALEIVDRATRDAKVAREEGPLSRIPALDALRGIIMLVMALDHANNFIAHGKLAPELWADQFPNYGSDSVAFLTRLVTHLAAPGFFFLMGTGMVLLAQVRRDQGWSSGKIARTLVVRGLILVALQFLVENPAWRIGADGSGPVYFGVLYALGSVMILGPLLLAMPWRWLLGLSMLLLLSIEALLPDTRSGFVSYAPALRLWLLPGFTPGMYVLYPIMPWLGVTGLGMAFGYALETDRERALRAALPVGIAMLTLFAGLRWLDAYGNIRPRQNETWIGFLNVVKYPPSLTFLLLTLGANGALLGGMSRIGRQRPSLFLALIRVLTVFGRVPLFFYVTHLYLYGAMGLLLPRIVGDLGISGMLPFWMLGLIVLYPPCLIYGRFKHGQPPGSLWRLF